MYLFKYGLRNRVSYSKFDVFLPLYKVILVNNLYFAALFLSFVISVMKHEISVILTIYKPFDDYDDCKHSAFAIYMYERYAVAFYEYY